MAFSSGGLVPCHGKVSRRSPSQVTFVKLLPNWLCHAVLKQWERDSPVIKELTNTSIPSLGVSRGFAFVEFYHVPDATSWMEANQVASLTKSRYS